MANINGQKVMTVGDLKAELRGLRDDLPIRFADANGHLTEYEVIEAYCCYAATAGEQVFMLDGFEADDEFC